MGSPFEHSTEQGPQADLKGFKKVLQYIESGKAQGARLVTGGEAGHTGPWCTPGIYLASQVSRMKAASGGQSLAVEAMLHPTCISAGSRLEVGKSVVQALE